MQIFLEFFSYLAYLCEYTIILPECFVMRGGILSVIALRATGNANSSSRPTRQLWHARSAHRYSRWRHCFYLRG